MRRLLQGRQQLLNDDPCRLSILPTPLPILVYDWYKTGQYVTQNPRLTTAEVTRQLRKKITQGTHAFGDRLPAERKMASDLKVSRGTIRSVLNNLYQEGFVDIRPGSGAYVIHQQISKTDTLVGASSPLELMDVRFGLEPYVCRLAVIHGRISDFDDLEDIAQSMEKNRGNQVLFSQADSAFHAKLVETSRNGLMNWIFDHLNTVRAQKEWVRMAELTLGQEIIDQYNQQHRDILNALRARDPDLAAKHMKLHLETARVRLVRAAEFSWIRARKGSITPN